MMKMSSSVYLSTPGDQSFYLPPPFWAGDSICLLIVLVLVLPRVGAMFLDAMSSFLLIPLFC